MEIFVILLQFFEKKSQNTPLNFAVHIKNIKTQKIPGCDPGIPNPRLYTRVTPGVVYILGYTKQLITKCMLRSTVNYHKYPVKEFLVEFFHFYSHTRRILCKVSSNSTFMLDIHSNLNSTVYIKIQTNSFKIMKINLNFDCKLILKQYLRNKLKTSKFKH